MTVDPRPETLAQFSAQVDEHLGYPAGFADAVERLALARRAAAVMKERREVIYRELELRLESSGEGALVVHHGGAKKLVRRAAASKRYGKSAPSAAVKKADKAAWEKAKVLKDWVSTKPPASWTPELAAVPKLPPVPAPYMDAGAILALYQHPAWAALAQLREEETAAKDDLAKIAAGCGWDGTEERFADGWIIALKRMEYDSEKLRAIDPALWEQLAVATERNYGGQLQIKDYDKAVAEGWLDDEAEVDEIDGD